MAISLRLDKKTEKDLEKFAKYEGLSKSEFIRSLIVRYLYQRVSKPSPWDLGKDLFGKEGSGRKDLSTNRKEILKRKLYEKKGNN